ncbi:unnamed protein product [Penicillium nalgiovense]|nr:unnamed protein product [Penicillium nalgiovense]CAG8033440.1 unnamed protein product [Penicillium nalgiovense]CAG8036161.1 unnamed protein product [Penicillium nalgiovense]
MIKSIKAAQRLGSRGNPTVQVELTINQGTFRAIVPSGASTGANEAVELRDATQLSTVAKAGLQVDTDQAKIDELPNALDGTKNKANLGANAILGVSMACARAGAAASGLRLYEYLRRESGAKTPYVLPVPFFNVLNGGVHPENKTAFQETMIAPVFTKKFGASTIGIGDEILDAGYERKVKFAIDPASSEFFKDGAYDIGFKDDKSNRQSAKQLMDIYHSLLTKYPIVLLEDPFAEDDWASWTEFRKNCPIELVGDDLLVTNTIYVQEAHVKTACDSMLLKINQIGTISEALKAFVWLERTHRVFVSHRSGETTDDFIADLVIGLRTGHISSEAPCRGERVAKYNRLMEIGETLWAKGEKVTYACERFRAAYNV